MIEADWIPLRVFEGEINKLVIIKTLGVKGRQETQDNFAIGSFINM